MKSGACILIVDDDPVILKVMADILNHQGYITRTTENGAEALQIAQNNLIDLVILDVLMPEMDGYTVCQQFKSDASLQDIPIIFLSAIDDLVDKVKGFQVGGVDYIIKPFAMEELLARIATHLSLQHTQKQLEAQMPNFN